MNFPLNHTNFIKSEALFWSSSTLQSLVGKSNSDKYCDYEFSSWISDLYWGEWYALQFSLIRANNSDNRTDIWRQVSIDEMKHFSLICGFLSEKGISQPDKSPLGLFLERQHLKYLSLPTIDKIKNQFQLGVVIQTWLEELIGALLKDRIKFIIDSDLQRIFKTILHDEKRHIGANIFEIENSDSLKNAYKSLFRRLKTSIVPCHFLDEKDLTSEVKLAASIISSKYMEKI